MALLAQSMQQSDSPVAELSDALARMAQTLNDVGAPLFGSSAGGVTVELRLLRDALARDLVVCIRSLQFHDRMIQQLTQARDLLSARTASGRSERAADTANEGSVELF